MPRSRPGKVEGRSLRFKRRQELAIQQFPRCKEILSEVGIGIHALDDNIGYRIVMKGGLLLTIYPTNQEIYGPEGMNFPCFNSLRADWTLLDAVTAFAVNQREINERLPND